MKYKVELSIQTGEQELFPGSPKLPLYKFGVLAAGLSKKAATVEADRLAQLNVGYAFAVKAETTDEDKRGDFPSR